MRKWVVLAPEFRPSSFLEAVWTPHRLTRGAGDRSGIGASHLELQGAGSFLEGAGLPFNPVRKVPLRRTPRRD